jgi:prepilin-type N-terminal cleavage/methylation domain-containing protein
MELNKNRLPLMQLLSRRLRLSSVLNRNNKGFTIVELIVTTSILVIVTTLIFANYPKFRENISLKKTAQEIALAIRRAQTYGLSVREFQPGSGKFPGYGVHFNIASSDSFILFADLDGDSVYDGVSENVESLKIQTGEKLSSLCANVKTSPPGTCGFNTIDIIFFRPKPLVTIKADGSGFFDGEIKIISPRGQIKTIVVLSSGQISVE